MSKNQSRNQLFQERTASFATHASRTGRNLLGWEQPEELSPEQQREVLIAAKVKIQEKLAAIRNDVKNKLAYATVDQLAQRKLLVDSLIDIESQLSKLKAVTKVYPDMGECIIEVLRSRMTKPQWECVLKEAHELFLLIGNP